MDIQNASTTPSKSNQLRNVNTVRWEVKIREVVSKSLNEMCFNTNVCRFIIVILFFSKTVPKLFIFQIVRTPS